MYRGKPCARTFGSSCLLSALLLLSLVACGTGGGGSSSPSNSSNVGSGNIATPTSSAATVTPTVLASATTTGGTIMVLSVDMAVSPKSLSGDACGSNLTVTYTATFHFPANNGGGQVAFEYTTTNGRSSTQAGLTVQPGQTSIPYQFTWSGMLPLDHTMPEPGGVIVTAPNTLNSALVGPTGTCTDNSTPFSVLAVTVVASPAVDGHVCGTPFIETYLATFSIAPNSPGGTVVFTYTSDNGRSNSQNVSLTIDPGQTTKTYKFTWKGKLPADHSEPGIGIVLVSAPNAVTSTGGIPSGQCTGA
ncbi:MAG TPA: hypothetical protein VGD98_24235 [Ktedonobacteraceae bacterium]